MAVRFGIDVRNEWNVLEDLKFVLTLIDVFCILLIVEGKGVLMSERE